MVYNISQNNLKLNFKIIKNFIIKIKNTKGIKVFGVIFLLFNRILISHVINIKCNLKNKTNFHK
jgi:hypothetical protein